MIHRLDVNTKSRVEFQDVTGKIGDIIRDSGVWSGVCYVSVPHTTAAVMINEHADPSVVEDIAAQLDRIAPESQNYRHAEGNSPAHIKSSLIGHTKEVLIEEGRPVLGTWQGIFFCEFDGPRRRSLMVKILAEK